MKCVALLPPELSAAQEQTRPHLPPDDAVPLVGQLGQVAVALDVALDQRPDDRLRGWPDGQRLLELFHRSAGARDPGDLRCEALDVLRLLHQVLAGDQQREGPVLVAALLDHVVEGSRDRLPHRPAVGTDDHHAADPRPIGQLRLAYDVGVPAVEVVRHLRDVLHEILLLLDDLLHPTRSAAIASISMSSTASRSSCATVLYSLPFLKMTPLPRPPVTP